jgi:hypothetical protein
MAACLPAVRAAKIAERCFPDQPPTIVPLALALATVSQSGEDAILAAADIGGDSESVASIAGGIFGARYPNTVNRVWYDVVEKVNTHELVAIAHDLVPGRGVQNPSIRSADKRGLQHDSVRAGICAGFRSSIASCAARLERRMGDELNLKVR